MKRIFIPLLMFMILSLMVGADEVDTLHVAVDARVLVFDRTAASAELASWAEDNDGYFTWKSEESVRIRVPDEKIKPFRGFLENLSEIVLQYDQSTFDLRENLLRSRSALEAREEVLAKNLTYLSSSDVEGTLELEREIRRLMNEVDSYRGQLRRLEHDRRMAVIQVELSFQHQTIPDSRPSRFDWINDMDFYEFMNAYIMNRGGINLGSAPIPLPDGFALVDKSPVYLAVSPEGVRLRVKKVKNYPEQTIAFWKNTLSSDLSNRGYQLIETNTGSDWGDGGLFEPSLWAMPWGTEDYLYLTGLRLNGGKIEILEMAGKAEYMMNYLGE